MHVKDRKKKSQSPKTFPQNKQKGKKENRLRTNVAVLFPLGFFSARVQLQKEWSVHQLVLHQSASAQSLGSYKSGFQRSSYFFFTFWFVFNLIKNSQFNMWLCFQTQIQVSNQTESKLPHSSGFLSFPAKQTMHRLPVKSLTRFTRSQVFLLCAGTLLIFTRVFKK